ncbi:MAG: GAF domain-containing protein [Raineya sp.]|nr:GAF domain-containing protein [Raineya sp.]
MLKNIKIRYIAYFFGIVLLLLAFVNYLVVSTIAIKPQQTQIIGYILQIREIANQMKLTLSILSNLEFYNEKLADDIRRLEAAYSIRFAVLESGGKVEHNNQKLTIPPPDEKAKVILQKIRNQWKGYSKDVTLISDKLTGGKSADTIKLDQKFVAEKYALFVNAHDELTSLYQERLESQYNQLQWAFIALGILNFLTIAAIYYVVRNLILIPIYVISQSSRQLARGNLAEKIPYDARNEIGYIARNINDLAEILQNATEFSRQIGQGNLNVEYKGDLSILENKESIVSALELMRNQLREVAQRDYEERWASEGVAQFSELLRNTDYRKMDDMCYEVIKFIVSYIQAQQGILFVLNDDIPNINEHFLEPKATFASNRRKIFKEKLKIGETLVGQAFADKETIFLDQVPDTYEKIVSALGSTTPRNVLIVPIIYQEQAIGVMEILSLGEIPAYKMKLVERLAEIFGSTLANAKAYDKSQKLFIESQEIEKRTIRRG